MEKEERIKVSQKQLKVFTIILAIIWLIAAAYTLLENNFKSTLIVLGFGFAFIVVLRKLQRYFTKMLVNYYDSLEKTKGDE